MPTPNNVTPQPRFLLSGGVALPAGLVAGGLFIQQVAESAKGCGVYVFHVKNFCASKPLNATQLNGEVL